MVQDEKRIGQKQWRLVLQTTDQTCLKSEEQAPIMSASLRHSILWSSTASRGFGKGFGMVENTEVYILKRPHGSSQTGHSLGGEGREVPRPPSICVPLANRLY